MKKRIEKTAIVICLIIFLATAVGCCRYKQLMSDVLIAQYFDSAADSMDWQTVYIRAIVPRDRFMDRWTLNAIRLYVIIRSQNIPNRIDILIYDNMENLRKSEEYMEVSFRK